jgi:hypothetical protein
MLRGGGTVSPRRARRGGDGGGISAVTGDHSRGR